MVSRRKALFVLVTGAIFSSCKAGRTYVNTSPSLQVHLALSVIGGRNVKGSVTFQNSSDSPLWLLKRFVPRSSDPYENWFKVFANGKEIGFTGRKIKRDPPTPGDFFLLQSGERANAEYNLSSLYPIPVGSQVEAKFVAFNPSIGAQPLFKIESNSAIIVARP